MAEINDKHIIIVAIVGIVGIVAIVLGIYGINKSSLAYYSADLTDEENLVGQAASKPKLKIISPAGGESYEVESTQTISWTSVNVPRINAWVGRLQLIRASDNGIIIDGIIPIGYNFPIKLPAKAIVQWVIPSDLWTDEYKIKIHLYKGNIGSEYEIGSAVSNVFSIISCTDSEGGLGSLDNGVKGTVTAPNIPGTITGEGLGLDDLIVYDSEVSDSCYGATLSNGLLNELTEYYCATGVAKYLIARCYGGCSDGMCVSSQPTFNLKEFYPDIFIKDNKFDGVIVVGDTAPADDVIAANDIFNSLKFVNENGTIISIDIGNVKLASEVTTLSQNVISVGSSCNNAITSEIEGFPQDCYNGLIEGQGIIKIYTNNGFAHIVVKGYSGVETRAVADVLVNYQDYNFEGTEFSLMTETEGMNNVEVLMWINSLNISNLGVSAGSDATFSWDAQNANVCDSFSQGLYGLPVTSSYTINNIQNSSYFDITCSNSHSSAIDSGWVSVNSQPILLTVESPAGGTYFGDKSETWREGETRTISWQNTANIHAVTIELLYSKDGSYSNAVLVDYNNMYTAEFLPPPTSFQWKVSLKTKLDGTPHTSPLTPGYYWIKVRTQTGDLYGINQNGFAFYLDNP